MATKKERLVLWLLDARAMENQAETMMGKHALRLENYPELHARIKRHIDETRQQIVRLDKCLKLFDATPTDDTAEIPASYPQAPGSDLVGNEMVNAAMAGYMFETMEVAMYTALATAAEQANEPDIVRVCETNLAEEQAMADWLKSVCPR